MSAPDRPEYLKKLAAFCSDTSLRTLSSEVVERARWIITDSIPVIAAGMQTMEMKALVASHLKATAGGESILPAPRVQRHADPQPQHVRPFAIDRGQPVKFRQRVAGHAKFQVALGGQQDLFRGHRVKITTFPQPGAILHPCQLGGRR